jgi:chromosome segregation ATPase
LKDEYDGLKKSYYRDLHRLVEERVRDEKIKLGDRLSKAEAKAMQHAKILGEKEALGARVLQESREKALLKQTKVDLEQKYRDRDDEAKALREGYVQLSNDNQALQTEKAVLQADYDELKEHGNLPEELKSGYEQRHVDQPAVVRPLVSSTAAFDRQAAELQHLDGLVAIWQTTLGNATAEMNGSADRQKVLNGKIHDAEQQLKKLKAVSPSKTHHAPNTKSNPKDAHKKQVVVDGTLAGQDVPKASVDTPGTLPKARVAAEAFPALRAPAVPKTTPSNTWKSLRLVDMPKEDTEGARKKFN